MITYKKLSETKEQWGIDVAVNFTDVGINITKTFGFADQAAIDKDFIARMARAVSNIDGGQTRYRTPEEVIKKIRDAFLMANTLPKEDFEDLMNTKISFGGEIRRG